MLLCAARNLHLMRRGCLQENEMPNRGELVRVKGKPAIAAAPAPADARPVIAFCAIGFIVTIGATAAHLFLHW